MMRTNKSNIKVMNFMKIWKIAKYSVGITCLIVILELAGKANAQTNLVTLSGKNQNSSTLNVQSGSNTKLKKTAGTTTWEISGANDWTDLQNYLPTAKINGITILVSLLPPSAGTYSEPYGNDFVKWAE